MIISRLCDSPWLVPRISEIYLKEWRDHYMSEWNISTHDEMEADIRRNYMSDIFVATDLESRDLIGTIAIYNEDLRTHQHLSPWISCLYVEPWNRQNGVAKKLVEHILKMAAYKGVDRIYLWCYNHNLKNAYERMGFICIDDKACVMEKALSPDPFVVAEEHQQHKREWNT